MMANNIIRLAFLASSLTAFVFCCVWSSVALFAGNNIVHHQISSLAASRVVPDAYHFGSPLLFAPRDDEASHSVVGWTPCRGVVAVACNL